MGKYKVLFHADENKKLDLTLKNIENLIKDIGEENVEIELVVNSEAISLMLSEANTRTTRIKELANWNVRFAVCSNSMKQLNVKKEELMNEAVVVPSGVGELVRRQAEGWVYIKP